MKTILIKEGCPNPVALGEKGENGVGAVLFDYSEWLNDFGNGAISLLVKRKGDTAAYPVVLSTADGVATWTISDIDTAVQGYGKAEYIFTIDDKVAKSAVFSFFVAHDLGPAGDPPDPYESWIDTLTELGGETLINAQAAQAAQEAAETAQSNAETAATNAATSATNAAQSAGAARDMAASALSSADRATASATAASGHATAAETAKDLAISAAESAQHSETQAELSASAAAESAESASGSAAQAQQSASNASQSATQAASSATNAASSATSASGSASAAATSAEQAAESAEKADIDLLKLLPVDTASGAIASFPDGADDVPVEALTVSLEPIQDLHGQSAPYPAGGGANKWEPFSGASNGVTFTPQDDDTVLISGTFNVDSWTYARKQNIPLADTGFAVGDTVTVIATPYGIIQFYDENGTQLSYVGSTNMSPSRIQVPSGATSITLVEYAADTYQGLAGTTINTNGKFLIAKSSTLTAWSPYSNLCPITGHTQAQVWREATYDTTAQPQFTIPLGQTVYGGTLDVVGGKVVVDRAMVDLGSLTWRLVSDRYWQTPCWRTPFSGAKAVAQNNVPVNAISSTYVVLSANRAHNTVNAIGIVSSGYGETSAFIYCNNGSISETPTGDFVYELATPITIDLTDIPTISTLLGQNNVWSDSGDVDVTYRADIQKYITKVISEALA